ncbi:MAG TPA: hypothetical protein VEI57_07790 [Nitrospirota bacterium]|nr:hypothetical protein [Nitrospirota bacterium]
MKTCGLISLIAMIVLGLSIFFPACGRKGGNGNLTNTQGAQAASESVASALNVLSTAAQLSNLASLGTSGVGIAGQGLTAFAGANVKATAASKFVASFRPALRKAQAIKDSATGFPIAYSCATGMSTTAPLNSVDSLTVDYDGVSTYTLTFNACLDGSTLSNGEMQISSGTAEIFTIGSSGGLFTVTDFASATSPTVIDMSQSNLAMIFTTNATSPASETIAASGTVEGWDYVLHTHNTDTLTNFSLNSVSTTTASNVASNRVITLTVNGSQAITTYVSDTDSTVNYNETISFTNFIVTSKTAASGNGNEYLNINGTFTVATTPEMCFDGTFSIDTTNDIQIDSNGVTQAGLATINSNAITTFLNNGGITVSIGGGTSQTYTAAQLGSLCAL